MKQNEKKTNYNILFVITLFALILGTNLICSTTIAKCASLGDTCVSGDASISNDTSISGDASISNDTSISGDASISNNTSTTNNNTKTDVNVYSYDKISINENTIRFENKNINITNTTNGLKLLSSKEEFDNTFFYITNKFDFDKDVVSRILLLYESQQYTSNISIDFYLDSTDNYIRSINLSKLNNKSIIDTSVDVSDLKLTGTHSILFKVNCDSASNEDISITLNSVQFIQSSIPVLYINIDEEKGSIASMNEDPTHNTKCYGEMTIQIPDSYICEYTDKKQKTKTYTLEYIKGRGNSTWLYNNYRKPYKIKLDEKANLFGMGSNKHWVLLANIFDNSLIRNKITYWLGEKLNIAYSPQSVFVDVVVNGEYYGNYMLCEQIRVDKNRVNIDDLEKTPDATDQDTISGGYLLSIGGWGSDALTFETTHSIFGIESPDLTSNENTAQYHYIQDYMQRVEDAIYSETFTNSQGEHYCDLIDVNSFVDYYWIQEFSKNSDAFATDSTYLYKERNGKLFFGPLWDFDYVAWGNSYVEYDKLTTTESNWYQQLFKDPNFVKKVKERWPVFKEKLEQIYKDGGIIDKYCEEISISQQNCFDKFSIINKAWESVYGGIIFNDDFGKNYIEFLKNSDNVNNYPIPIYENDIIFSADRDANQENSAMFLKAWIQARIEWIDNNIDILDNYEQLKNSFSISKSFLLANLIGMNDIYGEEYNITLTFDPNNGEECFELLCTALKDSSYYFTPVPANPKKEGYEFVGWFDEYDFAPEMFFFYPDVKMLGSMTSNKFTAKYIPTSEIIPIENITAKNNILHTNYIPNQLNILELTFTINPIDASFADDITIETTLKDRLIMSRSISNIIQIEYTGEEPFDVIIKNSHCDTSAPIHIVPVPNLKLTDMTSDISEILVPHDTISDIPINFAPYNEMEVEIIWLSTDTSIAYVDELYHLHACQKGEAEIRGYNFELRKYVSYHVVVE